VCAPRSSTRAEAAPQISCATHCRLDLVDDPVVEDFGADSGHAADLDVEDGHLRDVASKHRPRPGELGVGAGPVTTGVPVLGACEACPPGGKVIAWAFVRWILEKCRAEAHPLGRGFRPARQHLCSRIQQLCKQSEGEAAKNEAVREAVSRACAPPVTRPRSTSPTLLFATATGASEGYTCSSRPTRWSPRRPPPRTIPGGRGAVGPSEPDAAARRGSPHPPPPPGTHSVLRSPGTVN